MKVLGVLTETMMEPPEHVERAEELSIEETLTDFLVLEMGSVSACLNAIYVSAFLFSYLDYVSSSENGSKSTVFSFALN